MMIPTSKSITSGVRRHPLPQYIPTKLYIADSVFITDDLQVGMVIEVTGLDYECRDEPDIEYRVQRFARALKGLSPEYRIYQYFNRRRGCTVPHREDYGNEFVNRAVGERVAQVESLDTVQCWLVILYSAHRRPMTRIQKVKRVVRDLLSQKLASASIEDLVYQFTHALTSEVQKFCDELTRDAPVRILDAEEGYGRLQACLNLDEDVRQARRFRPHLPLDRQLCGTGINVRRNSLRIGDWHVRLLTLNLLPRFTHANMLRMLLETRAQFLVVSEFERIPTAEAKKAIRSKVNQVNTSKFEFLAVAFRTVGGVIGLVENKSSEDLDKPTRSMLDSVQILEETESKLENTDLTVGRFALTVVLYDEEEQRLNLSLSRLYQSMANMDMVMHQESFGLLRQYLAILPGNERFQYRYATISDENQADLCQFFLPQRGQATNRVWRGEYSLVLQSRQGTPVFVNLGSGEDTGNVFVCGQNGSGKSFLMNLIIVHLQKYGRVITLIFDVGGSYRQIVAALGGTYVDVDIERMQFTINPFSLPPTSLNKHFLKKFVTGLMESAGDYRLSDKDGRDLYEQILGVYECAPEDRRLCTLYMLLQDNLRLHLSRWVRTDELGREGEYGWVFDNAEDTLTLSELQCFDFSLMEEFPIVAEHMMVYIDQRHRVRTRDISIADVPKVLIMDEAHRFARQGRETSRAAIVMTAKQGRKHRSYLHLCTQNPQDMGDLERVLPEFSTFILLHNPNADPRMYRDGMGLSEVEITHVRNLVPKQELMVKHPGEPAQIAQLNATEWEQGVLSSTPEKEQKRELHEIRSKPVGREPDRVGRKRKDSPAESKRVAVRRTHVGAGS